MPRTSRRRTEFKLAKIGGRESWYITWSDGRRSRRKSTGTTVEALARRIFERFVTDQNRPPGGEENVTRLLAHYLMFKEQEIRDEGRDIRLYENLEYQLRPVLKYFGDYEVRDLSADLFRRFTRNMRACGQRDGSIRKYLAIFRAAINRCKKEGVYMGEVPIFDLPPSGPPRSELLTESQLIQFMETESSPHLDLFCTLMMNTLKRPSSILQLRWSWGVDFNTKIIDFQPPELRVTKKRRTPSPMNGTVYRALEGAYEFATCNHVIEYNSSPVKSIRRSFRTKAKEAGIPWLTPYVLRHTGASMLSMRGVPLGDIAEMMGSDEETVRRHYRKYQPDYLRTASNIAESLYLRKEEMRSVVSAPNGALTLGGECANGGFPPFIESAPDGANG